MNKVGISKQRPETSECDRQQFRFYINGIARILMEEFDIAFYEGHAHGIGKSKAV